MLTVFSGIDATDGGWVGAPRVGHGEPVVQAAGLEVGRLAEEAVGCTAHNFGLWACRRRRSADDERLEVQPQLADVVAASADGGHAVAGGAALALEVGAVLTGCGAAADAD